MTRLTDLVTGESRELPKLPAKCVTCKRPWVEGDTLCGDGCCSEDCRNLHYTACAFCAEIRRMEGQKDPSKEVK